MRIVVFGAGAVGSVIGGRLFQHADRHGHEVALVARGAHAAAINDHGLTINDPHGSEVVRVPAFERIDEVTLDDGDVVILSMKTQATAVALDALVAHAPAGITVACAQNGLENERLALRHFANVAAICVMLPAGFMDPGVVDASGTPHNAILDVGRYPTGRDAVTDALANAFQASGLASRSLPDVMRWKHTKLLSNLRNVTDALVVEGEPVKELMASARREAIASLDAAGLERASVDEDRARRADTMVAAPIGGRPRAGSSTWQSFARGDGTTEVDWLNGEVVLLGRLHGVPTPVNAMLCDLARWAAATGVEPRSLRAADLVARLPG
ncbi:MAG: 2-dehydropantoate 2-reductase [Ilumatobacteraceae bacterium]|nr:2-dehydropantoate 2-reductase [Ilumatobacteraceae bacterium]